MAPAIFITQLGQLLGLDEQTIAEQIFPMVEQMPTSSSVGNYLQSMIGSGPQQISFIRSYIVHRFPPSISSSIPPRSAPIASNNTSIRIDAWGNPIAGPVRKNVGGKRGSADSFPTTLARGIPPTNNGVRSTKGEAKMIEFSERATAELLEIDRALRSFKGKGEGQKCFCSARDHALSQFVPICPHCALILCFLNSPALPCPSCSHSPLVTPDVTATHIGILETQRETLIETESTRIRLLEEEEERERNAIVFPGLGDERSGIPATRGYSNIAGGGPTLTERIDEAYAEGRSLSGREFGYRKPSTQPAGKVLRLNLKTKEVKIVTKAKSGPRKSTKPEAPRIPISITDVEEHGEGFIDSMDDGIRSRLDVRADPMPIFPTLRVFYNRTLSSNDFLPPVWIEEREERAEEKVVVERPTDAFVTKTAAKGLPVVEKKKRKMTKKTKTGEVVV